MSTIAVLGTGAGGCAAAFDLHTAGHQVRLWNRGASTLAPHLRTGGVAARGVLGEGFAQLASVTIDLADTLRGADAAVACLPAVAHQQLADDLARLGLTVPLILNPGHVLGSAHFAARFRASGAVVPPIAELSTLTYVARKDSDGTVNVTGRAGRVRAAKLGASDEALAQAAALWPAAHAEADVLATGLANTNLVLHPPGAVLSAAWAEATGGDFRFYSQATTGSVATVMVALDRERRAVATALGHDLDPLINEMAAIGTVDAVPDGLDEVETLRVAVSTGSANAAIRAPESLDHRYYREDFAYGVVPFVDLARVAGTAVPVAAALLTLVDTALGGAVTRDGLTLARLGLAGLDTSQLRSHLTRTEHHELA